MSAGAMTIERREPPRGRPADEPRALEGARREPDEGASAAPPSLPPSRAAMASARDVGRGGLAIAVAKVSFIGFGFVQQLLLPSVLGVAGYGAVSRVLALVSVVNNVVVATSLQGVSRTISGTPDAEQGRVLRRLVGLHGAIALSLSLAFLVGAGLVAESAGAPHVTTPLRVASAVVLLYGLYAPLVGALNGRRRFVDQAGLDIFYGASRMVLLTGGAWLAVRLGASGTLGAALGFVAAAVVIVPIAWWRAGVGEPGGASPEAGAYLRFLASLTAGQLALNLLLQTDFFVLSRALGAAASLRGLGHEAADLWVGVYRAVQLFGFLPYQLLMSVTFVLFPMLARAHAAGDREAVQSYVQTGVRLGVVLTGLVVAPIAAAPEHVLRFAFGAQVAAGGADALRVLAPGMGCFAVLGITSAALTSLGHERKAAALTVGTVLAVATAARLSIPHDGFGKLLLDVVALGTALAMALAATVGGVLLRAQVGAFVRPLSLARVLVAVGLTVAVGRLVPPLPRLAAPLVALAMAAVYVGLLVLSGEVGRPELALARATLGKRAGASR